MFGAEILVAPILSEGGREREVYLPAGAEWIDAWNKTVHPGGQRINVPAPLETIPVFLKANSRLMDKFHMDDTP
jgi:alpha-D-xyloside xylohydrolase